MAITPLAAPPGTRPRRRSWKGWQFVAPFMIVFALVSLAPIAYSIYLSVFKNRLVGGNSFVGLDNYRQAIGDTQFWSGLGRVGLFLVVQVPIMLLLSLLVALALDSGRLHGKAFFRAAIFLPYAVPAVVATLMWGFMYSNQFGLVGNINDALHVALPSPLSANLALASIGNIVTWEFLGYNMLIFYSALQVVPVALYESAEIDGAGQWRIIRSIKLPSIRGATLIATIFSIIGSFQLFNEPAIMRPLARNVITTGYTPNMYAYTLSFAGQQYNYAATVAVIMGIITIAIAYVVQPRFARDK